MVNAQAACTCVHATPAAIQLHRSPAPFSASRTRAVPRLGRRHTHICEASYSKKTDRKMELPGAGLPLDNKKKEIAEAGVSGEPVADEASTSTPAESSASIDTTDKATMSDEEMARLANLYREQKAGEKTSLSQGVLDEIGLIEWPSPKSALLNTMLVITIVMLSSATLFGMNTLLADVGKSYYAFGGISGLISKLTQ